MAATRAFEDVFALLGAVAALAARLEGLLLKAGRFASGQFLGLSTAGREGSVFFTADGRHGAYAAPFALSFCSCLTFGRLGGMADFSDVLAGSFRLHFDVRSSRGSRRACCSGPRGRLPCSAGSHSCRPPPLPSSARPASLFRFPLCRLRFGGCILRRGGSGRGSTTPRSRIGRKRDKDARCGALRLARVRSSAD